MKILIMVLAIKDNSIYDNLVKSIRETWGSEIVYNIKTLFYYGNDGNDETLLIGDEIFTRSEEGFYNLGYKVIDALEYILDNFEFDYIFKMNCSSYLNKRMLKDLLTDKPSFGFYSGVIGIHDSIPFVSGSGSMLSRDVVKIIVDNKEDWDHSYIEDVSIGKLLTEIGIDILPANRVDIIHGVDVNLMNIKNHHYRCKNSNRELDVFIMNELYKIHKNK